MKTKQFIFLLCAGAWLSYSNVMAQPKHSLKDQDIMVEGLNIHYKIGGEGPAILFLHGFMLTHDQWLPFTDNFIKDHQVILVDLPGHGYSDMPDEGYSFEKVAHLMCVFLKEINIPEVVGIGHSAGAITLMYMAVKKPDCLRGIVQVAGPHRFNDEVRDILMKDNFDDSIVEIQDFLLDAHPGGKMQVDNLFEAEHSIALELAKPKDKVFLSTSTLAGVDIPILLIVGDRDSLFPIELGVELYLSLPNAKMWVVPGHDHGPFWPVLGGDTFAAQQFESMATNFIQTMEYPETSLTK